MASNSGPRVLSSGPSSRGSLPTGPIVAAGVAFLIGILIGSLLGGDDDATPPGAISVSERSEEGAVSAALAFTEAVSGEALTSPARADDVLQGMATDELAAQQQDVFKQFRSSTLGKRFTAAAADGEALLLSQPLAYEVESYDDAEADVRVTSVAALGAPEVPLGITIASETLTLIWSGDSWRIDAIKEGDERRTLQGSAASTRDVLNQLRESSDAATRP